MRYLLALLCFLAIAAGQALHGGALRPVLALPALALVGLAGVLGLFCLWRGRTPSPSFPCVASVVLLAGWLLWRALESQDAWLAGGYLRLTLACVVIYLLFASVLTNPHHRLTFVVGLLVLALIQAATAAWQCTHVHEGFPIPWWSEQLRLWYAPRFLRTAHGFFLNHNHLAWFLNTAGLVALALTCWGRWRIVAKVLCLYAGAMSLAGAVLSASRGGILSLAVGLGVFFLLSAMVLMVGARNRRLVALLALLAGLVTAAGTGWYVYESSYVVQQRYTQLLDDSYRSNIISVVGRQFQLEPLWGTGAGTFQYYGRQFRDMSSRFDDVFAHNDHAQLAADFGFPALALLLLVVVLHLTHGLRSLADVLRQRMAAYSRPQSHAAALLIGALSCLAVFVTHSFFDFNMQIPANALLAAAFLGMLANSGVEAAGAQANGMSRVKRAASCLLAGLGGAWLLVVVWQAAGPEYNGLMAENALLRGNWEEASTQARKGLDHGRETPALRAALGESFFLQSQSLESPQARWKSHQGTTREYARAVELAPLADNNRLQLARALVKAGRLGRAEEEVLAAIELNPGQARSYGFYAEILERSDRLGEAARFYALSGYFGNARASESLERVKRKIQARAAEKP